MYEILVIALGIAVGATVRDLRVALPLAACAGVAVHLLSGEWKMTPEFLLWDLGQAVVAATLTNVVLRARSGAAERAPG